MARHVGGDRAGADDASPPRIVDEEVAAFFEGRAARLDELGPTTATLYQDKNPDLATRRDQAERAALTPRLDLTGSERLLDVACGTGRWVPTVAPLVSWYHGVDLTPGFVDYARSRYADLANCTFSVGRAESLSLAGLGEDEPFDRILSSGVLIYLNDEQVAAALEGYRAALGPGGRCLVREPVAQQHRLTLQDHYSEELEASYNAIYRTRDDLLAALAAAGLSVQESGYVFDDPSLNNRTETRQEWFVALGSE